MLFTFDVLKEDIRSFLAQEDLNYEIFLNSYFLEFQEKAFQRLKNYLDSLGLEPVSEEYKVLLFFKDNRRIKKYLQSNKEVQEEKTILKKINSERYNCTLNVFKRQEIPEVSDSDLAVLDSDSEAPDLTRLISRDTYDLKVLKVLLSKVTEFLASKETSFIEATKFEIKLLFNYQDNLEEINEKITEVFKIFLGSENIYGKQEAEEAIENLYSLFCITKSETKLVEKVYSELEKDFFVKPTSLGFEEYIKFLTLETFSNYFVSQKVDGELNLMLANKEGIWLINPAKIKFLMANSNFANSVFFVEEVDSLYFFLELLFFQSSNFYEEPFDKKLSLAKELFELMSNKSNFLVKENYRTEELDEFFKNIKKAISNDEKLKVKTDGLIFTPLFRSKQQPVLKWKEPEDLTIDLEFLRGEKYMFTKEKKPFQVEVDFNHPLFNSLVSGSIVEMEYLNGKLSPRKVRYDKINAQSYFVAEAIFKMLKNPLRKEDLCFETDKIYQYILDSKVSKKELLDSKIPEKFIFLDREFLEQLLEPSIVRNQKSINYFSSLKQLKDIKNYLSWREVYSKLKDFGYTIISEKKLKHSFLLPRIYKFLLENHTKIKVARKDQIVIASDSRLIRGFELDISKDFPAGFDVYQQLTEDFVVLNTPRDCYNLLHAVLQCCDENYWKANFRTRRNIAKRIREKLLDFLISEGQRVWEESKYFPEMRLKELYDLTNITYRERSYSLKQIIELVDSLKYLTVEILYILKFLFKHLSIFLLRLNSQRQLEAENVFLNFEAGLAIFLLHHKVNDFDIFESLGFKEEQDESIKTCLPKDSKEVQFVLNKYFWNKLLKPPEDYYFNLFLKFWKFIFHEPERLQKDELLHKRFLEVKDRVLQKIGLRLEKEIKKLGKKEKKDFRISLMNFNKEIFGLLKNIL
jgi:hypothetical protein